MGLSCLRTRPHPRPIPGTMRSIFLARFSSWLTLLIYSKKKKIFFFLVHNLAHHCEFHFFLDSFNSEQCSTSFL